ncbi:cyclin-dependent kinase 6 [Schistocerca gregaria]|uniref:cyclin-dependent kinase 6 n=1 Tax=Schistocerca gregaria TaxID=7010 RepID=UPI00211E2C59|nr:cyclin-dependent kinase 6 [Schistocerca gregaria]XP_049852531.1 cyclin-dependent kinase 6 [Schistocerca gregaria]XP_049852532.1 cyclin-dependent kinase 6 [Schistocerca gregaria]
MMDAGIQSHPNFEMLAQIGNGAYGTVYRARSASGQIVAVKKVRVNLSADGIPLSTLREVVLLKELAQYEHPNIVKLLDVCTGHRTETDLYLFLVFEHLEQDLSNYIEKCPRSGMGASLVRDIMFQTLSGVDFLHSKRVIHRDLKPQNILISSSGTVKLADFGLAKTYDFEMLLTSVVVTIWYRAPEVLLNSTYATPVDIWSCGCIMAELFLLHPIFCGTSEVDQLDKIFSILGTPPETSWPEQTPLPWSVFKNYTAADLEGMMPDCSPDGLNLLQNLLMFDPCQRISAAKALAHPYFKEHGYIAR